MVDIKKIARDAQERYHGRHGKFPAPHMMTLSAPKPIRVVKIGRNETCPCGSNKKYKKCCIGSN
jgi:uncharacterized protein YecA (UPF0149 family)